jgi:hypothetical protein
MIVSTLYLPETTGNIQHQHVPMIGIRPGQKECSVMASTVRWWPLIIARSQLGVLR